MEWRLEAGCDVKGHTARLVDEAAAESKVGAFTIECLQEARDIGNEVAEQPVADRAVEGRSGSPPSYSCMAADWRRPRGGGTAQWPRLRTGQQSSL
jgi:hypothetical protein